MVVLARKTKLPIGQLHWPAGGLAVFKKFLHLLIIFLYNMYEFIKNDYHF